MFADKMRVLLILPHDIPDQARVFAGKATTTFKLPVSLQIVLRALVEEGLKRPGDPALLANVEGQAHAVRRLRAATRQGRRGQETRENPSLRTRRPSGLERRRRRT
jgi:hypothetical protein